MNYFDDENDYKSRHRKLDKHFIITINCNKVKILKYKIYSKWDELAGQEYQYIDIITKISNESFKYLTAHINIINESKILEIIGLLYGEFNQPGLTKYMYKITSYSEKNNCDIN